MLLCWYEIRKTKGNATLVTTVTYCKHYYYWPKPVGLLNMVLVEVIYEAYADFLHATRYYQSIKTEILSNFIKK